MSELNGKWCYRSFCPRGAADKLPAQLVGPWTRPLVMELTTTSGKVSGSAAIGPKMAFKISGSITPAVFGGTGEELLPEGIELVVDGLAGAVYHLRGYFSPGTDHLVGAVVAVSNDLGKQPDGTTGPFILFPAKS